MNGISYLTMFPEPASHRLDGPAVSALIIGRGNICMGKTAGLSEISLLPSGMTWSLPVARRTAGTKGAWSKILPLDHGEYRLENEWEWTQTGVDESGKFIGKFNKVQK